MALPVIVAGAARGLAAAGRGLAKGARGVGRRAGRAARRRPPAERSPVKAAEVPREEAPEETTRKLSVLLSPEGILMLSVGGMLDILSIIGAILIIAFGAGLLFAKIVYIVGLIFVGGWAFFRSGKLPAGGNGINILDQLFGGFKFFDQFFKRFGISGRFFKRHWLKLAGKSIPVIGDVLPLWTWTIYSELTNE